MKSFYLILILSVGLLSANAQDRSDWFEFYLPWDDSTQSITNMSAYLDAPAGKYGFLQVTPDGHFKFENKEQKEKFVGVVNVAISNFPTKEQAKIIAARMAKFGINLVRIHLIDVEWQYGLFLNSGSNTLNIDPTRLDRMDYFIKCLKDKGIYFNFCVHAGRIYKTADGIDAPVENKQSKYITLFNQKIIDLQKDFSEKTIGHVNPYTGLSYANDPAMANVELTNENSLFNGWLGWNSDYIFADREDGIGEFYSNELDEKFNTWLLKKYGNDENLILAWGNNSTQQGNELIQNGSFEEDFLNWKTYVRTSDALATISIDSNDAGSGSKSAKTVVTSPGSQYWHIHIKTQDFSVNKNQAYKICFYAKADSNRSVRLEIMENQTWKWLSAPTIKIDDEWQKYETYFNSTFDTEQLIVQFEYGKTAGTYWLDSVSIRTTPGVGLEEGESLELLNVKRTKSTDIGKFIKNRVGDNAEFYFDLEKQYTEELGGFLKNNLGVKCPVTFTNNYFGLASVYSQSQADYMDFHMYWDHPNYPQGHSDINFTLKNKSMMLNPNESTINRMMLNKVKNMPLVLSEYNHAYPYIFQCEAPSLLYAYGSFYDLDGIIWHAYYDYMNRFTQRYQDMFFDIAMHPVMMTQIMLAMPYRMGYISKAETVNEAQYKREDVFQNIKLFQDADELNIPDLKQGTAFLEHAFQHAGFDADSTFVSGTIEDRGNAVTSDTKELTWDGENGFLTIDNPYWQGATGYLGNKNIDLTDINITNVITTNNLNFASIHLIALDSLPISKSKRMLLLAGARLENEGLEWNETQTSLLAKGGTRALCEPVKALIRLKNSDNDSMMVYNLDERGLRNDSLLINQYGDDGRFLMNKKTLWYEIRNHQAKAIPQGLNDQKQKNYRIKIYPNPAFDFSVIDYSFPEQKDVRFVVYNSTGKILYNEQVILTDNSFAKKKLNLSGWENGMYFCGFKFKNGEQILDKLFVTN